MPRVGNCAAAIHIHQKLQGLQCETQQASSSPMKDIDIYTLATYKMSPAALSGMPAHFGGTGNLVYLKWKWGKFLISICSVLCTGSLTRLSTPNQRVFWAGGATSSINGPVSVMMDASPAPMTTRQKSNVQKLGAMLHPTDAIAQTPNPKPAR